MAADEGGATPTTPQERRRLVLSLVDTAAPGEGGQTRLTRSLAQLCTATSGWFGGAGAAVSLMVGQRRDWVVASTDAVAPRMAELPFTLGEGPAFDAFDSQRPVLVPDLAGDEGLNWPAYTSTALALGVYAVFSVPLHVGAVQLGVLEWYDVRPRRLDPDQTAMLLEFAAVGSDLLLGDPEGAGEPGGPVAEGLDSRLGAVLEQREQIYQAQGMVMVDLGIDLAEALARMRADAFGRGVPIAVVAREVIAGRTLAGGVE